MTVQGDRHSPLREDRQKEEKRAINEYLWARHMRALGPNVLDLP